jgi:hypothetical protein
MRWITILALLVTSFTGCGELAPAADASADGSNGEAESPEDASDHGVELCFSTTGLVADAAGSSVTACPSGYHCAAYGLAPSGRAWCCPLGAECTYQNGCDSTCRYCECAFVTPAVCGACDGG